MNHCEENKPAEDPDEEELGAFTSQAQQFLLEMDTLLDTLLDTSMATVQKMRVNILLIAAMKAALYEGRESGLEEEYAAGLEEGYALGLADGNNAERDER